jgi:hypothetical protein
MRKLISFLLKGFLALAVSGCVFPDFNIFQKRCSQYIPQKYRFGYQDVNISTSRPKLHVGDTIFVKARLNQNFFDSLSTLPVPVNGKVRVFLRVTLASYRTSSSVFAVDTTILKVFDQYFDTVVKTGIRKSTYYFDCTLVDGFWELDVAFVARRKGVYEINPGITEVVTGETLPKGTCMLGDTQRFNAKVRLVGKNNRIGEVYPLLTQAYEQDFGFFVD